MITKKEFFERFTKLLDDAGQDYEVNPHGEVVLYVPFDICAKSNEFCKNLDQLSLIKVAHACLSDECLVNVHFTDVESKLDLGINFLGVLTEH